MVGGGLLIAVFGIVFALYRISKSIVSDNNSFVAPVLVVFFSIAGASMFSTEIVTSYIVEFWNHGFGVGKYEWAGKAYFIGSAVTSVFATWYLDPFSEDSFSLNVLRQLIKIVAAFVLWYGAPNFELSLLYICIGIFVNYIEFFIRRIKIAVEVNDRLPSSAYSATRLLTQTEYKTQATNNTKRELLKLQDYLNSKTGEKELQRVTNNLLQDEGEGKLLISQRLERFAFRRSSGLPTNLSDNPHSSDLESKKKTSLVKKILFFLFTGSIAAYYFWPEFVRKLLEKIYDLIGFCGNNLGIFKSVTK